MKASGAMHVFGEGATMIELGAVVGYSQLAFLVLALVGMIGARLCSRGIWQVLAFGAFLTALLGVGAIWMASVANGGAAWHSSGGLLGLFSVGAIAEFGSAARSPVI
jgi:hypothetical protein